MEYNSLIKRLSKHYGKNLPFVVYSLPESDTVTAYFQEDDTLHAMGDLLKKGFALAPFDDKDTSVYIPEEACDTVAASIVKNEVKTSAIKIKSDAGKNKFIAIVKKSLEVIKQRKAIKIVVSRFSDIEVPNFNIELLIKHLFSIHGTAFRYVWFHPKTGLWCGATPEILVQTEGNSFKTMSLAGTQEYTGKESVSWSPKEIDEQQLVTDSITTSLQRVTSVLKVSNSHTYRAGSLLHLRTNISGVLKTGKTTLSTIAAALHPTPAVCGSPQRIAKDFILSNEGYSREYYTGFLGPVKGKESPSTLVVNLRCMKIVENVARIYVGCGITIGSDPEKEWKETKNKMQTMLQVLQPML